MRTFLLSTLTLFILTVIFVGYWMWQPDGSQLVKGDDPIVPPRHQSDPDVQKQIGEGRGVWVNRPDQKTGRLVSQFRAEEFSPQPDDSLRVTRPEVRFYLSNGQMMSIRGATGTIVLDDPAAAMDPNLSTEAAQYPRRGLLLDVQIDLYETVNSPEPILVVTLPNAAFDDETSHIYTQKQGDVPGDQIPVIVRGDEYDFDGKGLSIRWNEADQRLQSLEVAHGERLVLKNPGKFGGLTSKKPAQTAHRALPLMLASAGNQLPGPLAQNDAELDVAKRRRTTRPATTQKASPLYRATFNDDVRILQADATVGTADTLLVDFSMTSEKKEKSDSATAPVAERKPTPRQARHKVILAADVAEPEPPTTSPAPSPVTILWTGKLTMVPLEDRQPLGPEEAVIRMRGRPVTLNQKGGQITCASLIYRTTNENLTLEGDEKTPIELSDARGAKIRGTSMRFLGDSNIAVLEGPSSAVLPLEVPAAGQPPSGTFTIQWQKLCTLTFLPPEDQNASMSELNIKTAQIEGDVIVDHPQIDGRSDKLDLAFEPGVSKRKKDAPPIELRELQARGNVRYVIMDEANGPQNVEAQQLELRTASADGKLYPETLIAEGNVHLFDAEQHLYTNHLDVTLAPTTRPTTRRATTRRANEQIEVELKQLAATGNVSFTAPEDRSATADQLSIVMDGDDPLVTLKGAPATLGDGRNRLSGPEIHLNQKEQSARVIGEGTLHAIHQPKPTDTPRPLQVSWKNSAIVDGPANLITVTGDVSSSSTDPDGTVNGATAQTLLLTLADAPPSTQPTTRRARRDPATKPAKSGAFSANMGRMDALENKIVRSVTLKDNVEVRSTLTDAAGALLRGMNLFTSSLEHDIANNRITIPGGGRMLYRDHRPVGKNDGTGTARGATAFEWGESLNYDQEKSQIVMSKDVTILHRPDGENAKESQLSADRVTAELEKAPTTRPATIGGAPVQMQIKRLIAEGNLVFRHAGIRIEGETIEFDPNTGLLIARGTDRAPVRWFDEEKMSRGTVGEIHYNVETGRIEQVFDVTGQIRR